MNSPAFQRRTRTRTVLSSALRSRLACFSCFGMSLCKNSCNSRFVYGQILRTKNANNYCCHGSSPVKAFSYSIKQMNVNVAFYNNPLTSNLCQHPKQSLVYLHLCECESTIICFKAPNLACLMCSVHPNQAPRHSATIRATGIDDRRGSPVVHRRHRVHNNESKQPTV